MSGSLSALVGLIEHLRGDVATPYWLVAGLFFVIAIFLVWRDIYREARPYDEETFQNARAKFNGLPNELKQKLKQLLIEKSFPHGAGDSRLEATIFVRRDGVTGHQFISPGLEPMLERLVNEWGQSATQS